MENKRIELSSPHMSEEKYEQEFVQEAFDTNWVAPLGKNVDEFEQELAAKVGTMAAAALSSGTAAIHLALKSAGVGHGDIVFCSTLTFSATANPIIYQNATPVFIDSDYNTWNMSVKALKQAFQKYPDVKAVVVVHLYGIAAQIEEISEICRKHKVPLIEDAAESLGTTINGKYTGTFGDYGVFSFNGNKIITTSGGGALVCNLPDKKTAEEKISKARFWATQAKDKARHYQHSEIGYNYRMSNIVAGIGRGQLKVLDRRVIKKREIYEYYKKSFEDIEDIDFMPMIDNSASNCWLTSIQIRKSSKVKPLDIMKELERYNIDSRPVWKPMHLQPVFEKYDYIDNGGVGQDLFGNGVCLPSDTKMTYVDLKWVAGLIRGLWGLSET